MKYYVCQSCGQDFEAINPDKCPFCGADRALLSVEDIGGVEHVDYVYTPEDAGQDELEG